MEIEHSSDLLTHLNHTNETEYSNPINNKKKILKQNISNSKYYRRNNWTFVTLSSKFKTQPYKN